MGTKDSFYVLRFLEMKRLSRIVRQGQFLLCAPLFAPTLVGDDVLAVKKPLTLGEVAA